jgi:hypothetical protein
MPNSSRSILARSGPTPAKNSIDVARNDCDTRQNNALPQKNCGPAKAEPQPNQMKIHYQNLSSESLYQKYRVRPLAIANLI